MAMNEAWPIYPQPVSGYLAECVGLLQTHFTGMAGFFLGFSCIEKTTAWAWTVRMGLRECEAGL